MVLLHGSNNLFEKFDINYIDRSHNAEGWGIYFTDDIDLVRKYADNYLYICEVKLMKPLSATKKTITFKKLCDILTSIERNFNEYYLETNNIDSGMSSGEIVLSNYVDTDYLSFDEAVYQAARSILDHTTNDADVFMEIVNSSGSPEIISMVFDSYGYNYIVSDVNGPTVYVIQDPDYVKILKIISGQENILNYLLNLAKEDNDDKK